MKDKYMKQMYKVIFLVTCLQVGSITIAAVSKKEEINTKNPICSVSVTSDNKYLLVGHGCSQLSWYDVETNKKVGEYRFQSFFAKDGEEEVFTIGDMECAAYRLGLVITIFEKESGQAITTWDPSRMQKMLCHEDGVSVEKTTEGAVIIHGDGKRGTIQHVRDAFIISSKRKLAVGRSSGELTLYSLDDLPIDES